MAGVSAGRLLEILGERGLTLGVAESCTGGLLGAAITAVPGASNAFAGGFITYTDRLKSDLLGVDAGEIEGHGAVSASVVEAMAHGVRDRMRVDMAIAVSGVAGPGGGTEKKPVGTVWIAIMGPEHLLDVKRYRFDGDREAVRRQSVEAALQRAVDMVEEAELEGVA